MSDRSSSPSQLFTVRLWTEAVTGERTEVRGTVRHVATGETLHFRAWTALAAFLTTKTQDPTTQANPSMTPTPGTLKTDDRMAVGESAIADFAARLRGSLLQPENAGYDEARTLFNAMIDKKPRFIARCADVADVISAVNFGRENGLLVAIRGGGHNGPGLALCDDGLTVDLSAMNAVYVDPKARTVRVEGGATWGDVDHATHAFGLAAVSGIISTTGVGGLTLGGGHGYLTRKYGLTIDNLLEADLVLADGRHVTTSADQHPDLFWALRGGGGNFGVVTSFLFRVHPVETAYAGPTLWPMEQAETVLRWYRGFLPTAPRELYGFLAFLTVPPGPPFPEALHLKKMCGVVWCYTGPENTVEKTFAPVLEVGEPAFHGVQAMPYPAMQNMFDALYAPGHQWYWKGDFVREIPDEAVALHVEHGATLPSMLSTMHLYPIDGAVHDVEETETAWSYRDVTYSMVIVGVDSDPEKNEELRAWTRSYWKALHPFSAGGAYPNFLMDEGQERVRASYRGNYNRLAQVKAKYDPDNLFRVNKNIQPAAV